MEPLTASLHAGMIQRARPKVVPLRDDAFSGGAPVVQLRASDVVRSRPEPAPLARGELPGRAPVLAAVRRPVEAAEDSAAGGAKARRFGLTVRVGGTLRQRLLDARMRTGRTTQSILHDALVGYLAALERKPIDR